ncbi:hypothetical protein R5R35_008512 [Gryllus longicercus]|uniref:Uncharacterized protein n=1 Tax=Gryllus longicercus TaxID=2509291 RepID=A0AAN9VE40_9ORTH
MPNLAQEGNASGRVPRPVPLPLRSSPVWARGPVGRFAAARPRQTRPRTRHATAAPRAVAAAGGRRRPRRPCTAPRRHEAGDQHRLQRRGQQRPQRADHDQRAVALRGQFDLHQRQVPEPLLTLRGGAARRGAERRLEFPTGTYRPSQFGGFAKHEQQDVGRSIDFC